MTAQRCRGETTVRLTELLRNSFVPLSLDKANPVSHACFTPLAPPPPGLVLVGSPLLALMRDQLDRLPEALPGAMLWGGLTRSEAEVIIADAARGAIKLL